MMMNNNGARPATALLTYIDVGTISQERDFIPVRRVQPQLRQLKGQFVIPQKIDKYRAVRRRRGYRSHEEIPLNIQRPIDQGRRDGDILCKIYEGEGCSISARAEGAESSLRSGTYAQT